MKQCWLFLIPQNRPPAIFWQFLREGYLVHCYYMGHRVEPSTTGYCSTCTCSALINLSKRSERPCIPHCYSKTHQYHAVIGLIINYICSYFVGPWNMQPSIGFNEIEWRAVFTFVDRTSLSIRPFCLSCYTEFRRTGWLEYSSVKSKKSSCSCTIYIVTKSDEFVQSRRFICNTWLINIFQCLSSVIILK